MPSLVTFCHGPEAERFTLADNGIVVGQAGRTPFHGIISRGLLELAQHEPDPGRSWPEVAHLLDANEPTGCDGLAEWRRRARVCGVLGFGQSAAVARAYAERLVQEPARTRIFGLALPADAWATIELWNVKEGHTSSVWRMRAQLGSARAECAINVSRDRAAARELRRTSRTLRKIARCSPEARIARVHEIATIRIPELADPVVVTCNEWIGEARELHRIEAGVAAPTALVAVERFIAEDALPSAIGRIAGQRLTAEEAAVVERDVAAFLASGAALDAHVDINDGDLVWDGRRSCVVAMR